MHFVLGDYPFRSDEIHCPKCQSSFAEASEANENGPLLVLTSRVGGSGRRKAAKPLRNSQSRITRV